MFWAFKLSFDVNILAFWPLFPKIGRNSIQFYGHTALERDKYLFSLKNLVRDKHSSLFWCRMSDKEKSLDVIDTLTGTRALRRSVKGQYHRLNYGLKKVL
jgi:hypothetical protein